MAAQGELELPDLANRVLGGVAAYVDAKVGALHVKDGDRLRPVAIWGEALGPGQAVALLPKEGTLRRVAADGRLLVLESFAEEGPEQGAGRSSAGSHPERAHRLLLAPTTASGRVNGVVALAFSHSPGEQEKELLGRLAEPVGMALHSALHRRRLEQLLAETQRQAEQLTRQRQELFEVNASLERQKRELLANQRALSESAETLQLQRAQLSEQLEKLRESLRLNETFAAVLGHDLRNPLAAIMASAETIERHTHEDRSRAAATRIRSSGLRMRRMIEQLLDFSRVRLGGEVAVRPAPTSLLELCQKTLQELQSALHDHRIELRSEGDPSGSWDGDRLLQVLSNLIGNAARHGDASRPIQIGIDGRRNEWVVLRIRNGGVIPPEILPHVFEPFRSRRPGRRSGDGLGLGLYIVRQMVLAHGGRVEARSSEEGGTLFELTLPRSVRSVDVRSVLQEPGDLREAAQP
jgi:signal transduction histidine kinase